MQQSIAARRLVELLGDFPRTPAYLGLAESVTVLVGDGRIGLDVRLPSERELAAALGVSRTTATRAYARLVETGYAAAVRGAGTFTRVPGSRRRAHDQALMPRAAAPGQPILDLTVAATTAPPGVVEAYAAAVADLPSYLGGHGYFPVGLPAVQAAIAATYDARGLPTRPDQVMVTSGAVAAASIVAHALLSTGDRVLVDSPTYPNAVEAVRRAGGRPVAVPMEPDGWDTEGLLATVQRVRPRAAYLLPDFHNPTGLVMEERDRRRLAASLRSADVVPIVDETHHALVLDEGPAPTPFGALAPSAVSIGSASKSFWGGLRIGWVRVPDEETMRRLVRARLALDLGAPLVEQLALTHLLRRSDEILPRHLERLRVQRSALVGALRDRLPEWEFRIPRGGLCLWCRLPAPLGTALAVEAEKRGVVVVPGPAFAVDGGLDRFVRLPWTRPAAELERAVAILAQAWSGLGGRGAPGGELARVIVA